MNFILKNKYYIVTAISIYILILIPSLNTPFQSDDYAYFLKDISLDNTISHYMGWSGRLVVDFTSSFILKYLPYFLYEIINSFVFLTLCIFISLTPMVINNNHGLTNPKPSAITLWLIFITYWLANPNLGQTSFWIVGSVNYLWTIMWASFYLCYLLKNINSEHNTYKQYVVIIILGLLAGCSNENTGVSIVIFNSILIIFQYKQQNPNTKITALGLIGSFIGAVILIAAPGNKVRQTYFSEWYNLSTFDQIIIHITERMPNALLEYNNIYISLALFFIVLIIHQRKSILKDKTIIFSLSFFVLSLFSNFILAKAPYIGGRNLNTGLFFLVLCLSCIIYSLRSFNKKTINIIIQTTTIIYSCFFSISYLLFTNMMIQANYQQQVRENIIATAIENNKTSLSIPDWYFMPTLKRLDVFDTYQSGAMPQYYGIQSINWKPINFNYAILITGKKLPTHQIIHDELQLLNIYLQQDNLKWKSQQITLEFNESLKKHKTYKNSDIIIKIHKKDGHSVQVKQSIYNEVPVGNNFYINTTIDNLNTDDINSINIELHSDGIQNVSVFLSL